MKKEVSLILIFSIFLIILILNSIKAETPNSTEDIQKYTGQVNQETGLPESWTKYKETADSLTKSEQNNTFLKQEWTKLLAKNKVLSPILFYTDKFFSFFNPLWKYSFGTEFQWSFGFFIAIFFWTTLTIFIYFPAKEIFKNPVFGLITGIITASITGASGIIPSIVNLLDSQIRSLIGFTIFTIFIILFLVLYGKLFKQLKKEDKQEKLKRADDKRLAAGEVAGKFLDN